jgi:methylated-DNA-[protein]-cysteine S-methyltransferase
MLPRPTAHEAEIQLSLAGVMKPISSDESAGVVAQLQRYALGESVDFSVELDPPAATPFLRCVWDATVQIPRGETRSYGWLAASVGLPRAARAVGLAMQRNPLPIIVPCHRVVAWDGKLGGYGGGLDLKRKLLQLEGVYQSR